MTTFRDAMHADQLAWRARHLPHVHGEGVWMGRRYEHILPRRSAAENLWPGLRDGGVRPLEPWLAAEGVQPHQGRDNLLSSWTLCANLYFPFGEGPEARALLAGFFRALTGLAVARVRAVALEYALPAPHDPGTLLGEHDGKRGANQTSPDVAFELTLEDGREALVLTEVKFVEHSFYDCSGCKALTADQRRSTCWDLAQVLADPATRCAHAATRGRRYWDHLTGPMRQANAAGRSRRCPAAKGGYQLFRQQALAEALAHTTDLAAVVSSVAYDARNTGLLASVSEVADLRTGWGPMFAGRAGFVVWSHQAWFRWVAQAEAAPAWAADWLVWVGERYGYAGEGGANPQDVQSAQSDGSPTTSATCKPNLQVQPGARP